VEVKVAHVGYDGCLFNLRTIEIEVFRKGEGAAVVVVGRV
jgi:hypothetical protein